MPIQAAHCLKLIKLPCMLLIDLENVCVQLKEDFEFERLVPAKLPPAAGAAGGLQQQQQQRQGQELEWVVRKEPRRNFVQVGCPFRVPPRSSFTLPSLSAPAVSAPETPGFIWT